MSGLTIDIYLIYREDYDAGITDVTKFLIRNDVDPILRQRFVTYLQLGWYTDKVVDNYKFSIYPKILCEISYMSCYSRDIV